MLKYIRRTQKVLVSLSMAKLCGHVCHKQYMEPLFVTWQIGKGMGSTAADRKQSGRLGKGRGSESQSVRVRS